MDKLKSMMLKLMNCWDISTEHQIKVGLQLMADRKDMKGKAVPARHFKNLATDNEDLRLLMCSCSCVMGEIVYG